MRALVINLCLAIGVLGSSVCWAQHMEAQSEGRIETVDIPANTLMVSGLNYRVPVDANVQINGTFGAFTLLQRGMKVRFTYRTISRTEREIISLEQLPDSTVIQGT